MKKRDRDGTTEPRRQWTDEEWRILAQYRPHKQALIKNVLEAHPALDIEECIEHLKSMGGL